MREGTYLPVKILALKFHQSPKTVRGNINEMSKDTAFKDFVVNPREKGAPKLAELGAYAIWVEWKPKRKSYLWKTIYAPKVKALLNDLAIGAGWMLMFLIILGTGLHVWAAPIRDGVHTEEYITKPGVTKDIGFTPEERDLLLHVMMCEAGNQGAIGAAHVGRVILNRVESDAFPDTVRGVIYQPGQFSTASYLYRYEPNADCYAALDLLEHGWDETHGALYFCTTSFSWATYLYSYGGHNFFC